MHIHEHKTRLCITYANNKNNNIQGVKELRTGSSECPTNRQSRTGEVEFYAAYSLLVPVRDLWWQALGVGESEFAQKIKRISV
ncbi:uncharacterized protein LOC141535461 isoform X2 [Cotesia typhae]|uniref:uncharacterized protein LOC141535461 isoform X2 n=1 Tax=Cotesia typhae TaxID=2053667 RepID=UPI003D6836B9